MDNVRVQDRALSDRPTRTPIHRLLRDLRTGPGGLTSREAARRLIVYGPNQLPTSPRPGWLSVVGRQLLQPLALLLWLAAGLAVLTRTPVLGVAIVGVIVINSAVAVLQEHQASRAVAALARYLPLQAKVVRDCAVRVVPAMEIVVGDVLVLLEGDRVCADARLIDGAVEVDLSTLTGESFATVRSAGSIDDAERLIDAPDAVFSGSTCRSGQARAAVFATGSHTELGRIAALSQRDKGQDSPLERQVRRTAWIIAAVAVAVGAMFLPLGIIAGLTLSAAAVFAVGLLVANVPEGLLPTITLALAVGVRALAKAGALVKRLSAVETLGSTTVICTDKTGTLTENRMRVAGLWYADRAIDAGVQPDRELRALAEVMADCADPAVSGDPMEDALRSFAERFGVTPAPSMAVFRFDPRRMRMSIVTQRGENLTLAVKGAPERVLPECSSWCSARGEQVMAPQDRVSIDNAVDCFAERGLRVLALASRRLPGTPSEASEAERALCFVGLVALQDPPRPEVSAAVRACHAAGIRVHVVTGDHGRTAAEIARQVGIRPVRIVTGSELDGLGDAELDAMLAGPDEIVFARSAPEGKLRIAEALRHHGEVVAMTGDGVNDAPALQHADIGVAMGLSGTDVAREAATMVLTDDNFATIVTAVREGRRVYDNIRKFVLYIFAHAVPEVVPFLIFALSAGRIPLPLTVLQILVIDLGTETLPALALGRERGEPDIMNRPPRRQREHLITGRVLGRAWLLMGTISAALAMVLFLAVLHQAGWHPGVAPDTTPALMHAYRQATTTTFATIVACQVGTAFAARTERASLAAVGVLSNPLLLAGIAFELGVAALVIYTPPLQEVFGTAAPPPWVLMLLVPCPVLVWVSDEVYRYLVRHRQSATGA
jgi:calcium-translocating P-type ATPase